MEAGSEETAINYVYALDFKLICQDNLNVTKNDGQSDHIINLLLTDAISFHSSVVNMKFCPWSYMHIICFLATLYYLEQPPRFFLSFFRSFRFIGLISNR